MQKFFENKNPKETYKEIRAKEYIRKYIKELQRHFDISDRKMRIILYRVYKDLSPLNIIKSWVYMIKSKYEEKLKFRGK